MKYDVKMECSTKYPDLIWYYYSKKCDKCGKGIVSLKTTERPKLDELDFCFDCSHRLLQSKELKEKYRGVRVK